MKKLYAIYHRYTNKRVKTSVINFSTIRETQKLCLKSFSDRTSTRNILLLLKTGRYYGKGDAGLGDVSDDTVHGMSLDVVVMGFIVL